MSKIKREKLKARIIEWAEMNGHRAFGAQTAFARETGINKNTITSWIRGLWNAEKPEHIEAAAKTLGLSEREFLSYFSDGEKEFNVVNPNEGKSSVTLTSPVRSTLVPVYGKVTGGTFRLNLNHPTEDTLAITKPATGTYIGLTVHGNGLEEYRLFAGDGIMVELQDWALDSELVLLKEGEEFTIARYNKGKEKRPVIGVIRKRVSDI
jgi:SOS-response transcriptional repressor LexA